MTWTNVRGGGGYIICFKGNFPSLHNLNQKEYFEIPPSF
jgi:hypothetical protein